jgi:hypothetical protein
MKLLLFILFLAQTIRLTLPYKIYKNVIFFIEKHKEKVQLYL